MSMNKILKLLIFSDILLLAGFGFINPIFAIFINQNISGGNVLTAGIASSVFLITLSVLQILFSYKFNPKDRWWMLILGTIIIILVPFAYLLAKDIIFIYGIQIFYGIGAAFSYPAWRSFFSSNLEKGRRGFQWSLYSSGVGIGAAITAVLGGLIAEKMGFHYVFILTGIFALAGFILLFFIDKKEIMKKV